MKIVAADPTVRVLSEDEVLALLKEPIVMHLGLVDGQGWPLVNPVWHVFERDVFRLVVGKTSHKAKLLRAAPRAYFAVDKGGASNDTRGVRGRAAARVIDGDVAQAEAVCRAALIKYTGSDENDYAKEMLTWARDGSMSVVELTPSSFRAFAY
jgi:nitroimidazol reductase NimA-like FMN-containing flavoprotein (pyridoxamine 5'-phosphate oxidase superfamily)